MQAATADRRLLALSVSGRSVAARLVMAARDFRYVSTIPGLPATEGSLYCRDDACRIDAA